MSKQQWTWEPVENELIHIHDTASVDQCTIEYGTYLEVNSAGDAAGARLPDDLRLCRRVPASAGVPVEALNRITAWVADWCNGNDDGFDDLAADVIDVRTWLRSLAPAQGQEGE